MRHPPLVDLKARKVEADRLAQIDRDLAAIELVLRVHAGLEFQAVDFPTLAEGRAAFDALTRLRVALGRPLYPVEPEQGRRL